MSNMSRGTIYSGSWNHFNNSMHVSDCRIHVLSGHVIGGLTTGLQQRRMMQRGALHTVGSVSVQGQTI